MAGFRTPLNLTQRQRIGVVALVATGAFFIWRSLADLPLGTIDNPGPGAMPILLALLLIVFALWSLTAGRSGLLDDETAGDSADDGADDAEPGALRHAVLIVASIIVAAVVLDHLGYRLTILTLLLFFLGLVERKPLVTVLIVSFGLSFGSHALFEHVLKIGLPSGPFGI
jgi:tripartite tricarboxylate transporter TctB family protein